MKLTKAEKAWVETLNKHLADCPSKRLGFATIGDWDITIYDATQESKIDDAQSSGKEDFIPCATKLGLVADERINFPNAVLSTAG